MKKITALLCSLSLLCSTAYAFTYPEPDWGALLKEKESMVNTTELELYTEGSVSNSPYYGARLEPQSGTYIGMVAENAEPFKPIGGYLTYIQDMWQDDLYHPANVMIQSDNVITMVGWIIDSTDSIDYNQVRRVLDTLNSYNKPMLIRFANEMNVSALGDDPYKYQEVFRTVANMIHEYPNFAVVWAPNDLGALDRPFEYFYPGDEYVDWIGVSCYSIKYFQGEQNTDYKSSVYFMTGDYAWATNRIKPIIDFMQKNNIQKPVMISEGGVATNTIYDSALDWWAAPRLRNMLNYLVMKYPQIKMINYFNTHRANEPERFDISDYGYAAEIFNEAKNSGAYITEYGASPEFVYAPASNGETLIAKDGIVPLYTYAYFANQPYVTVNYSIDGNWYHASGQIPYACNMNISELSDGGHILTISAFDQEKTYTFYKRGNLVCFGNEPDMSLIESNYISDTSTPQNEVINVLLNGEALIFDQPPIILNERTLVPLRVIFESLGASVKWDDATQTITAEKNGIKIVLQIGNNEMKIGDDVKVLDVPAQLVNDRTLVPVRAVSEAFNCSVEWVEETQTVLITK